MKYFKIIVSGLKYTATTRLNVLEEAIRKTQTDEKQISLKLFKDCIGIV